MWIKYDNAYTIRHTTENYSIMHKQKLRALTTKDKTQSLQVPKTDIKFDFILVCVSINIPVSKIFKWETRREILKSKEMQSALCQKTFQYLNYL